MCIAVYKPENIRLTKALLKNCFDNNPDGAGFAYPSDSGKTMLIERGFFGFRKFWIKYRDFQDKPMLIHFRIATSGKIDAENSHPWALDKSHAFVHNGIIQYKLDTKSDTLSDTGIFVNTILSPLFKYSKLKGKTFWAGGAFKWLMEEAIGVNNKMAILSADGMATIFNEKQGEWEHGAWWSNKTYKEDRKSIRGTTVKTITCGCLQREITKSASGRESTKYITVAPSANESSTSKTSVSVAVPEEEQANKEFQQMLGDHPEIDISMLY